VADEEGNVVLTIEFSRLVFSDAVAARLSTTPRPSSPEADILLIERAKEAFARVRKSHADIRNGLDELRSQVRRLARYSSALDNGSG
jgi:ribosomal protein S15P/S13E